MNLTSLSLQVISILFPILILYIVYLFFTKSFRYMGFSKIEAILIVFVSFLFGFNIIILGFNISNIPLFYYNNWLVSINMGGGVIPIILSIYLAFKNKIKIEKIVIGLVIVSAVTYLITSVSIDRGIVAQFPYALLPALSASLASVILSYKSFKKAAPLAYISGTIGVLIGADFLRLPELLSYKISGNMNAIIGGADVFDMIFITGVLAVLIDGLLLFNRRRKEGIN